ncbi:MAG: hypothetical protein QM817_09220 [Archangium sp.]
MDVVVTAAVVLIAVEALFLLVAGTILQRRFGAPVYWNHPIVFVPLLAMGLSVTAALEAIIRKRGETTMVVHCVTTLLVAVGVPAHFARLVRPWFNM